uniref:Uncharacterized protein n=1 Tax=Anguilla anguilla TaxID=7936 RepID=A0A0E9X1M5_ANGAN
MDMLKGICNPLDTPKFWSGSLLPRRRKKQLHSGPFHHTVASAKITVRRKKRKYTGLLSEGKCCVRVECPSVE